MFREKIIDYYIKFFLYVSLSFILVLYSLDSSTGSLKSIYATHARINILLFIKL